MLKSCTRAHSAARERQASITYDSIGVGAAAGAKFNEINAASPTAPRVSHSKFNAGGAVYRPEALYMPGTKNKDMFSNIKAQAWWGVADRLRATFNAVRNGAQVKTEDMLILDSGMPHLSHLIDELCTPKRDYDNASRVKVESKKDLAKREVPSPNLADALVMAYAPGAGPMKINPDALRRA